MNVRSKNKKEQLIQATLQLIALRGLDNISMKQVITRANVATGTCYHYFKSKDELLQATLESIYNNLTTVVRSIAILDNFEINFLRQFETLFNYLVANPDQFKALRVLQIHLNTEKSIPKPEYVRLLETMLERGVANKQLVYLPGHVLSNIYLANLHTLVAYQLEQELLTDSSTLTKIQAITWNSMKIN